MRVPWIPWGIEHAGDFPGLRANAMSNVYGIGPPVGHDSKYNVPPGCGCQYTKLFSIQCTAVRGWR